MNLVLELGERDENTKESLLTWFEALESKYQAFVEFLSLRCLPQLDKHPLLEKQIPLCYLQLQYHAPITPNLWNWILYY